MEVITSGFTSYTWSHRNRNSFSFALMLIILAGVLIDLHFRLARRSVLLRLLRLHWSGCTSRKETRSKSALSSLSHPSWMTCLSLDWTYFQSKARWLLAPKTGWWHFWSSSASTVAQLWLSCFYQVAYSLLDWYWSIYSYQVYGIK